MIDARESIAATCGSGESARRSRRDADTETAGRRRLVDAGAFGLAEEDMIAMSRMRGEMTPFFLLWLTAIVPVQVGGWIRKVTARE